MFVSVRLTNNFRFSSQLAVIISANSREKGGSPACSQNFFFLGSRICHLRVARLVGGGGGLEPRNGGHGMRHWSSGLVTGRSNLALEVKCPK